MQTDEFYETVEEHSPADSSERAAVVTEAVLETLGETLTGGEAEDVATQLPDEVASHLEHAAHDGSGYDREEFLSRVGEHLRGTELESESETADLEGYTQGVIDAIAAGLTESELQDVKAQLREDVRPLFDG